MKTITAQPWLRRPEPGITVAAGQNAHSDGSCQSFHALATVDNSIGVSFISLPF